VAGPVNPQADVVERRVSATWAGERPRCRSPARAGSSPRCCEALKRARPVRAWEPRTAGSTSTAVTYSAS